jgi:hypothetical protein
MSVLTEPSMSALPPDHFAHVLELLRHALVGGDDGVERIADLARDPCARSRQAHREVTRLHCVQRIEEILMIEIGGDGIARRPSGVPVGSALARGALTGLHENSPPHARR